MQTRYALKFISAFAAIAAALGFATGAAAAGINGTWLTADGESQIQIYKCGSNYCGKVVWLRQPLDENGQPFVDNNNPEPSLRNRQLIGLRILYDLAADGGEEYNGYVYNPQDGSTYIAVISLMSSQQLSMKGCILGGVFCGSQTWSRVGGSSDTSVSSNSDVSNESTR